MSYKTLPWSHDTNKTVHLILHAVALFLGSFGVYAAFKFHNESGIDNLYSLHSWVGLGAIILYGLQVIHIKRYHLDSLNSVNCGTLNTVFTFAFLHM
jgi:hypothetical protein